MSVPRLGFRSRSAQPRKYRSRFEIGSRALECAAELAATDLPALLEAVEKTVVDPILDAAKLFDQGAYLTRLYTTMSASEMTVDPTFDYNPDLEDVSNIHVADRQLTCDGVSGLWRTTLPDGRRVYGQGSAWPFSALDPGQAGNMPFTSGIVSFSTSGQPKILTDNTSAIDQQFVSTESSRRNAVDGGCSIAPAGGNGSAWGLSTAALAWLLLRKRRSARA